MDARSALSTEARRVRDLALRDRRAAAAELASLSLEDQVALICEAPLRDRNRLLTLAPAPEEIVPLLPDAELCFTVKAVGITDASWILDHASSTQIVAAIDLDGWSGLELEPSSLDLWMATLAAASETTMLRAAQSIDTEVIVRHLIENAQVFLDPRDNEWQAPPGAQTLDGQFYILALQENNDIAAIMAMLGVLFRNDYWLYFRMMQGVIWEIPTDLEEWALRWRTGRLQDLGFPPWDEAMRIYGYLRPEHRAEIPAGASPLELQDWSLPVWITDLPAASDARHLVFRALSELDPSERQAFFYAFIAMANTIAVADRMPLGDAETLTGAIEKAAKTTSLGLAFIAEGNGLSAPEVLRRVELDRLFRVGSNLAPKAPADS